MQVGGGPPEWRYTQEPRTVSPSQQGLLQITLGGHPPTLFAPPCTQCDGSPCMCNPRKTTSLAEFYAKIYTERTLNSSETARHEFRLQVFWSQPSLSTAGQTNPNILPCPVLSCPVLSCPVLSSSGRKKRKSSPSLCNR